MPEYLFRTNLRIANGWGPLTPSQRTELKHLTSDYCLSVASGHLSLLDGRWYVTHAGLLTIAQQNRCAGIRTTLLLSLCSADLSRWIFKATVYKSSSCRGFVGFGDANPSNVSSLLHGAEMRVAETRAVNRALRKAYGIGICSVEEVGPEARAAELAKSEKKRPSKSVNGNGWKAEPKLRDRLCQLIRQHQLDPVLVKSYAIDFCGTKTLKDANREQVEKFVTHLADWATRDKNALFCQLNSYLQPQQAGAA
jgi:hypothetical protein